MAEQTIVAEQWTAIDAFIFANRKLEAVKAIRELTGFSLVDALVVFYERYALLRAETPERFVCSNREYWTDFYTDGPQPPMAEPGTLPDWTEL